ncbi:hypothetical protein NDU88_007211 [Pleurodeles waltl]|uniref:Uncharacterized protein n=1 Tax=Pleurodeles waltl TaxID=8319 RepID=A0AAV7QL38_PLEWA|nr:hypothetical protein NDU88_007211 [Pleurodeles waltl]
MTRTTFHSQTTWGRLAAVRTDMLGTMVVVERGGLPTGKGRNPTSTLIAFSYRKNEGENILPALRVAGYAKWDSADGSVYFTVNCCPCGNKRL